LVMKMSELVEFKSVPENYAKEKSGVKPNTERTVPSDDPRFSSLNERQAKRIRIINAETKEYFERIITDITWWDGRFTISWRHLEEKQEAQNEAVCRTIASNPDSIEVGTPSKGGAVKLYGDFARPESFKLKIKNARELREIASRELGGGA